jgi:hypothetical protein
MTKAGSPKPRKISAKLKRQMLAVGARCTEFHKQHPQATRDESIADMVRGLHEMVGFPEPLADLWTSHAFESDRGCVLVAASLIDNALEALLTAFFSSRAPNAAKVASSLFAASKGQDIPPLQNTSLSTTTLSLSLGKLASS